jgi:hypothetical protein
MTVFFPVNNVRTMDFNANDVGFLSSNALHLHREYGRYRPGVPGDVRIPGPVNRPLRVHGRLAEPMDEKIAHSAGDGASELQQVA